ncbi:zf-TFIIB domain-containing protein [Pseudactinotalea sp.]|uniref:TFIIB-type zinc ribbon-containing protein n=1 Tax=Pseudactinotalea sp. TaxID=1926260 RepID=UPI003B3A3887
MQCPTDGTTLVMSERSGIEIDYCPQCRGVWLDRGELDKIIERSLGQPGPAAASTLPAQPLYGTPPVEDRRHADRRGYSAPSAPSPDEWGYVRRRPRRRRESWLSDLFD